jgi:ligand-binding sensor domain-containing protein
MVVHLRLPGWRRRQAPISSGIRFGRITTEDGLSHNTVTSILQDSRGFMWFGTEDGLNRYGGYAFTVYRHDPDDPHSLRDDSIMALYEDRAGVLWIGTQTGWLERPDEKSGQFSHHQFGGPVLSMYQDRTGEFWVGTWDALYRFDQVTEEFEVLSSFSESAIILSIHEDRDGVLWFGSWDGWLHFLDRAQDLLRPVPITIPVTNYRVTSIYEDGTGALWNAATCRVPGSETRRLRLSSQGFEQRRSLERGRDCGAHHHRATLLGDVVVPWARRPGPSGDCPRRLPAAGPEH